MNSHCAITIYQQGHIRINPNIHRQTNIYRVLMLMEYTLYTKKGKVCVLKSNNKIFFPT